MDLTIFQKLLEVFKYMFSSFLSIELVIICLLIFIILILNTFYNNKIYKIVFSVLFLYSFIIVLLDSNKYFLYCLREFIKIILMHIIFPSTIVYFFITFIVVILLLYSIISTKMTKFKKIFNYVVFMFFMFLFYSFTYLAITNNINLLDKRTLYENDLILSVIQISNLTFIFWIIYTVFYYLYNYFKKKFD